MIVEVTVCSVLLILVLIMFLCKMWCSYKTPCDKEEFYQIKEHIDIPITNITHILSNRHPMAGELTTNWYSTQGISTTSS